MKLLRWTGLTLCAALLLTYACVCAFGYTPGDTRNPALALYEPLAAADRRQATHSPVAPATPAPTESNLSAEPAEPAEAGAAQNDSESLVILKVKKTPPSNHTAQANGDSVGIEYIERDLQQKDYDIPENEERYAAYMAANPDIPYDQAIAYVNIRLDAGYYQDITVNQFPEDLLVLCNKNHQLPGDYAPEALRKVGSTNYLLRDDAASDFERMTADMAALGMKLVVYSAYRSYDYQYNLYNRYASIDGSSVADTYSARAGHSEHQTGLAIDFLHKGGYSSLRKGNFQDTEQYAWLMDNAHKYGFILRYPKDYVSITGYMYEPWHWRYIGAEAATIMYDEGIATFEEFWGKYLIQ